MRDRLCRWLWRKCQGIKALWSYYPNQLLHNRYELWRLPVADVADITDNFEKICLQWW